MGKMIKYLRLLKVILPGLLGLVIYFTIRLITDSALLSNHFLVDWWIWTIEIVFFIITGYLYGMVITHFNRKKSIHDDNLYKLNRLIKEFVLFYLYIFIITNAILTSGAAFTDDGLDWHDFIVINIIPVFYCFIVYLILKGNNFIKAYINSKVKFERLARDKAEEELKFLKGQFQPHFLFNALNTIYFQMDESVEGAKKSIEKLSDLLRYRLYEDDSNKVLLLEEVEYLKKYIEFQTIRASAKLKIDTNISIEQNDIRIYPFLMLPLIENAFKYVSGDLWIKVELSVSNKQLNFKVSNSIDKNIYQKYNKGGVGLRNVSKRLQLLYKDNYTFDISSDENSYIANLKIEI